MGVVNHLTVGENPLSSDKPVVKTNKCLTRRPKTVSARLSEGGAVCGGAQTTLTQPYKTPTPLRRTGVPLSDFKALLEQNTQ